MAEDVNRWSDPQWALRYLRERDSIPHRAEGFAVFLEMLPERVERVLDLGTGDGHTLALVLQARPAAVGIGLDFQEEMLGRARERFCDDRRASICHHDLRSSLSVDLGDFDLVVSSFAIHHLPIDRQRALHVEVFRRMRRGGTFLHMEHVASPSPALHEAFLRAIGKTPEQDDPSNKLVPVATHLEWWSGSGFRDAECLWKWRELALLGAVRAA